MAEPSFLYCGLDAETRALAQELETLGGGDATLDTMDVHAIIDDRLVKGDMQVLWAHNKTVGLRNALLPRSQPEADTMSYTTVTSTQRLSDMLRAPIPLVDDVARWTLNRLLLPHSPTQLPSPRATLRRCCSNSLPRPSTWPTASRAP
jgi:hypothetical protein